MRVILITLIIPFSILETADFLHAQTPQLKLKIMQMTFDGIMESFKNSKKDLSELKRDLVNFIDIYKDDIPDTDKDDNLRNRATEIIDKLTRSSDSIKEISDESKKSLTPPKLINGIRNLQKQINYPMEARKNNIEGRIFVRFILDEEGNVTDPETINTLGYGIDEEVLRVIKLAKFEPATIDGNPIKIEMKMPLFFSLN